MQQGGENFEKQRQKDLKSKRENVRAGAATYGDPGQDNGVHVKFENKQWFVDSGEPTAGAETDPYKSGHGKTNITVTFLYGQASGSNIAHEGTHVLNDQTFLNSWDLATKTYDISTNFVRFYTEEKAYLATFDRYGPNDVGKVDSFLLASPYTYGYAGNGRRVTKTNNGNGNETVYVYDAAGLLAAEYNTGAVQTAPACVTTGIPPRNSHGIRNCADL